MRVALINPNRMKPAIAPIALEYLAQALGRAGQEPHVVDLCFADDPLPELRTRLAELDPGLVAMTIRNSDDCYMATQSSFVPQFAEWVKAIHENCDAPVVLGGSGFSATWKGMLARTGADMGVVGDGEAALVAVADALEAGDADPRTVAGVVSSAGRMPPSWRSLEASEPLAWQHVDIERYFHEGGQAGLETKRGCPMPCTYCADPLSKGTFVRPRPIPALVAEVSGLVTRGVDHFHLCDAEINLPIGHLTALCEALADAGLGERMRWYGYATPHGVDDGLTSLMRRSGCAGINFGVDHGDDGMLRDLGRGYTAADIERAVLACRRAGIAVMCDLLLGSPGETMGTIATTLELMKRLDPLCVGVSLGVRLYAGTAIAETVRAQGPLAGNPNVRGQADDNDDLAMPVYYAEHTLGPDAEGRIAEMIGDDARFFFGGHVEEEADYNYNDNQLLVAAIAAGARGAYWHILSQLRRR